MWGEVGDAPEAPDVGRWEPAADSDVEPVPWGADIGGIEPEPRCPDTDGTEPDP
ncbi:hypothetical protein [Streptomyces sp. NPDC059010]|uniref:hypothetical protein n=1 Tax=Streptomyces sp. NPDC059010 TaxID=3346695 RepID=UPI0036BBAE69